MVIHNGMFSVILLLDILCGFYFLPFDQYDGYLAVALTTECCCNLLEMFNN